MDTLTKSFARVAASSAAWGWLHRKSSIKNRKSLCHCERTCPELSRRSEAISLHNSLFLVRHSIFTTTFTFLLLLFLIASPAQAKYGGGTGEPNDPYLIFDANQMNAIGADSNDWDKHFKLMADIDLGGFTGTSFNIIGYYISSTDNKPFTGVFDGNGKKISNFTYTSTGTNLIGRFGYVGLFGYVKGQDAEIKDLGLIDPNVDAGTGNSVGSLVGWIEYGTISNCYLEGGSVAGNAYVGGLVGKNDNGKITNSYATASVEGNAAVGGLVGVDWYGSVSSCYSTGSVGGHYWVGGLVGGNWGSISNCYSTGSVSGEQSVGGLVGRNSGSVSNCYSTGDVSGGSSVGGLVGLNDLSSISNCYSTGSVSGEESVGGLVGHNWHASVSSCYSTGDVSGSMEVGGLVGYNNGSISSCYSTSDVSGDRFVGGLVGENNGSVSNCFWDTDTQTHGVTDSIAYNYHGTVTNVAGLSTAQMQTKNTFADAGWDFNTPVWTIYDGLDYPRLWWEGMQVPMKMTPRTLNCRSKGNWVKAHLTLPEGFTVEDVDPNRPAVLHSFGIESAPLYVSVNENERVQIEAAFEREAVCSLTGDWPEAFTVAGFLTDGNIFLGTSKVRMIAPGLKEIEELALYWLNADCVKPDWCGGIDLNRDSLVNLLDYALLLNSQFEFVSE